MEQITTQCCIVGGGPAGMLLGHILARAGIDVVVLEKHPDFFRDFRGDTIHAQSLEILHQLGLDAHRFSFPYLGLNQRLIGPTDEAQVVKSLLT